MDKLIFPTIHKTAFAVFSMLLGVLLLGCDSPEECAQSYYEKGKVLLEKGDPVKASLEFRNSLKAQEGFVPALYSLGVAEEMTGRLDNAAKLFLAVTERAPDHINARVQLGTIYLMSGETDAALKLADEAYALSPTDPEVLALKGAISLKLGDRNEASRFADEALKADPQNLNALIIHAGSRLAEGDAKGALAYLDKTGKSGEQNIIVQLLRVEIFQRTNDKQNLEQALLGLVEMHPKERSFKETLVRWYLAEDRGDDAEAALRSFADRSPEDPQAQLDVVDFLHKVKGTAAAEAELRARIGSNKNNFAYKAALARLVLVKGDYDGAVDIMRSVVADTKDPAELTGARLQLARIFLTRGNAKEATPLVDAVLADDEKNVEGLMLGSQLRQARQDLQGAIDDLTAAANQAPQSGQVAALLAAAHEANGASSVAEELYHKALTLDGARPAIGLEYARFLLRYGKTDKAEEILTQLANVAPTDRGVLTLLAQVQLSKQDWAAAQKTAEALRKTEAANAADHIDARALAGQGKGQESAQLLEASLTRDGSARAALVQTYLNSGDIEKAEELLKAALSANGKDVEALMLLGSVYTAKKQPGEAEKIYKTALELNSSNPVIYAAIAQLQTQRGDTKAAEETLREALRMQPQNTTLRLQLAMVLQQSSREKDAITEYEVLFAADPRSTLVANNLASLLSETEPADLDRALNIASRFEGAEIPHFQDTLGWIYFRRGDYGRALASVRAAAEKMPEFGIFQYHLGMIYKALGQRDRAEDTLKRAVELLPKDSSEGEKSRMALNELSSPAPEAETKSN